MRSMNKTKGNKIKDERIYGELWQISLSIIKNSQLMWYGHEYRIEEKKLKSKLRKIRGRGRLKLHGKMVFILV